MYPFRERFLENLVKFFNLKLQAFFFFIFLKEKLDTFPIEPRDIYSIASTLLRNQTVFRISFDTIKISKIFNLRN